MSLFSYIHDIKTKHTMARKGMLSSRKVSKGGSRLHKFIADSPLTAYSMLLILMLASAYSILLPTDMPDMPGKLVEGQSAPETVYSAFQFSFEDSAKTEEFRNSAAEAVPLFFRIDKDFSAAQKKLTAGVAAALQERADIKSAFGYAANDTPEGKIVSALDDEAFRTLSAVMLDGRLLNFLTERMSEAAASGMISSGARAEIPAGKNIRMIDAFERLREPKALKDVATPESAAAQIAAAIIPHMPKALREGAELKLVPSFAAMLAPSVLAYDEKYTSEMRKNASDAVTPVITDIKKGAVMVRKGDTVTAADIAMFEAYGNDAASNHDIASFMHDPAQITKSIMLSILLVLFCAIYISHIHPEIASDNRAIWLIGSMTLAGIFLNVVMAKVFFAVGRQNSIDPWLLFMGLPLAFAPLVIATVYGLRTALYSGLYISLVAALSNSGSFDTVLTGLIVGGLAAYAVKPRLNYRSHFMWAFVTVAFATLACGLVLAWKDNVLESMFPWIFILPVATGFITAVITQFMLYILETFFDTTTKMALLTYSDYNHPLLKRLQFEAPGTYHHSLVVSMLAEAAADETGADAVKARVCALFHDVGKLAQPEYFTENSTGGESKHKELSPKISAMIILNHVKEGMELAHKYKLKKPIRDAIEQHHGTDLVYYFYKLAKDSGDLIEEHDYRYPGPVPQTVEVAIISLADACEAASRSLEKPTHGKIDELVSEILLKRMRNGQLGGAKITFRELEIIRASFVKSLTSMLHARIAYPKDESQEDITDENDLFMASQNKKTPQF